MSLEWFCSAVVAAAGSTLLGHFGEGVPKSRRLSKWAVYFGVAALISKTAGRPWTFVWILGLPATGAVLHVWWCRRHGINPITAEPRDEYYRLRGWGPLAVAEAPHKNKEAGKGGGSASPRDAREEM